MKRLLFVLLLALSACGPESSPEGRLTIKLKGIQEQLDSINNTPDIQKQLDSLKSQNASLADSMKQMSQELKELKKN